MRTLRDSNGAKGHRDSNGAVGRFASLAAQRPAPSVSYRSAEPARLDIATLRSRDYLDLPASWGQVTVPWSKVQCVDSYTLDLHVGVLSGDPG